MSFDPKFFQSYQLALQDYPNIWTYQALEDSFSTVAGNSAYFNDAYSLFPVHTGDKLICNTTTAGLSFSGTFRISGTNIFVDWDRTFFFETQMSDVSAASTVWFSVPPAGIITQVYGTQWSAVTAANSIVTFSIGSTAITGGAITVTPSGVAGTSYSATPTALNITNGSTAVKAVSDGGSSTTAIMTLGFKIICPAQV